MPHRWPPARVPPAPRAPDLGLVDVSALDVRTRQPRSSEIDAGPPAAPRFERHLASPALLLGIFLACLYLLTMGGHLDSPDEELMFQVTRSLAERGSMDI